MVVSQSVNALSNKTPLVWAVMSRSIYAVCALLQHIVMYICFEFNEKATFIFPTTKLKVP